MLVFGNIHPIARTAASNQTDLEGPDGRFEMLKNWGWDAANHFDKSDWKQ